MLLATPFLGFVNQLPTRKNKKRKSAPRFCFPPLHYSPAGELHSIIKMDHVKTKTEKILKTDYALEMSAQVLDPIGREVVSANVPALGPPAGLNATAQPLADLGSGKGEGLKRGQKQQGKKGRRKEKEKVVTAWESLTPGTRQQPQTFPEPAGQQAHLLGGVGN